MAAGAVAGAVVGGPELATIAGDAEFGVEAAVGEAPQAGDAGGDEEDEQGCGRNEQLGDKRAMAAAWALLMASSVRRARQRHGLSLARGRTGWVTPVSRRVGRGDQEGRGMGRCWAAGERGEVTRSGTGAVDLDLPPRAASL